MGDAGWGMPRSSRLDERLASAVREFKRNGSTGNMERMFQALEDYDNAKANPISPTQGAFC